MKPPYGLRPSPKLCIFRPANVFIMPVITRVFPLLLLALTAACGSSDITLLNEVKRFEPEWTRLSATVTDIKANLRLTEGRYAEDLKDIKPYLADLRTGPRSELADMRSRYSNMMTERDSIQQKFQRELARFEEEVYGFNLWVNDLMRDKVDPNMARDKFDLYQRRYYALEEVMNDLYQRLIANIEEHNALMRRMAAAVNLYGNYEITPR